MNMVHLTCNVPPDLPYTYSYLLSLCNLHTLVCLDQPQPQAAYRKPPFTLRPLVLAASSVSLIWEGQWVVCGCR